MATTPFATAADVAKGWRLLTSDETARASDLLAKASRQVRAEFPTIDARITAEAINPDLVADVVCDMVRRVLVAPVDQQPVSQMQQAAGPFSVGMTYANPTGDMYLTKSDRKKLGGAQRAASIDTAYGLPYAVEPVWDSLL